MKANVVSLMQENQLHLKMCCNLNTMYNNERNSVQINENSKLPEKDYNFEVKIEIEARQVYRQIQKALKAYKEEKRGPTLIAVQAMQDFASLCNVMPILTDFPLVPMHITDSENLYNVLDWQRVGAKVMLRHFLKSDMYFQATLEQCRYFHVPIGNLPKDTTMLGMWPMSGFRFISG